MTRIVDPSGIDFIVPSFLVNGSAVGGSGDALTTQPLSQFAATTSAQLAGVISDETGSGVLVFNTSPTFVTPILGTPQSGNLSNCTAYPLSALTGLGANVSTFLATPSSANLFTALTTKTGSGGSVVFSTSPTLSSGIYNGSQTSALGTMTGVSIDLATGILFAYSMAGNATFSLTNIPSGFCAFILRITYTSGVATWTGFTNLKWDRATPPVFTASRTYDISFTTTDSGANWTGQVSGEFY